ncbi:thioredoxin reductase [Antricoccus suffuscus]|uniref:Thioredoxin reductase n=1 Tax=Antricoccus suffuscus TaxID=1629062 RepID=A0A2T1A1F2_9ACTN|nr:NAD(P)/FAD-dependent oxidoreductase [Antricoccus suffuscus]PRZ42440.1 thioredoxin reductase [Antricoccus suffuscus]
MNTNRWDVVVIGGGPAGLSTALTLVRARRRVLVLDSGLPRNRFAAHMHGVLGHDGKSPLTLLAEGRAEVEGYGGVIREATVVRTGRVDDGFEVEDSDGRVVLARKLVVATGLRDELPDIEGLADYWGRGVAVCPYCDGYEVRDRRIGVLATSQMSVPYTQLVRQWSSSVVYLADTVGPPTGADRMGFDARGIEIEEGAVRRVIADADGIRGVEMADGRTIDLDAIFTHPHSVALDEPLRQLGADRTETPLGSFVNVDPTGRTSVAGVWAVGNTVNAAANVPASIGAGSAAGGALNYDLVLDDVQLALGAAKEDAA